MGFELYRGDCAEVLKEIDGNSIDLTVTSPPYDNLRTYNGFTFDFETIAKELYRVTKQGGVVVWNVADATIKGSETGTSFRQALFFMECGFKLHDTMIWAKPNPIPTQHNRYQNAFEFMFVLSKGAPSAANILREPSITAGRIRKKTRASGGGHDILKEGVYASSDTKTRNNWWVIPVGGSKGTTHPAAFPETLARDHILSWSNEGDLVLDPFMGSGTTGVACANTGRNFIGIEMSKEYFKATRARVNEAYKKAP